MIVKRVLLVHASSDLYGAGKVALETIRALKKAGVFVIVGLSSEGPLCQEIEKLGCKVEIISLGTIRRKYLTPKGLVNRFFSVKKSLKQINEICERNQIDTIYTSTTAIITGALYKRKHKSVNHIWHVLEITPGPRPLLKFYAYLLKKYTNLAFGVSGAVVAHWKGVDHKIPMVRLFNSFSYQGHLGPNDLREELGFQDSDIVIGMIARVHFWKGQEYFLQIAESLTKKYDHLKFVLVGDAFPGYEYLYDEIRDSIEQKGLGEVTLDLGYRTDVEKILNMLDVFVLPSTQPDPLPTSLLEAMAAGKAIVATNHGGAPEMLVDGESGYLIPYNDSSKAAETLAKFIENRDEAKRLGENAKVRVREMFSREGYEKNLLEALSNL